MSVNFNFYDIQHVLMDYDTDLLADGAEWYLTEGPQVIKKKAYEDSSSHGVRGRNILSARTKEQIEEERKLTLYMADFKERNNYGENNIHTELCIDEKRGEFVRSWCDCYQFQADRFACKHIAGLVIRHLMDKKEPLEESRIEKILQEKTGYPDPFRPGRLRRTSAALRPMMDQFILKSPLLARPAWETGEKKAAPERLSLQVYLSTFNNALAVELKSGSKKLLQIKNIDLFLEAYQQDKVYDFSAAMHLAAGPDNFAPDDRELLDYLCQVNQALGRSQNDNNRGLDYEYRDYNNYDRYLTSAQKSKMMFLTGHNLDHFMEILDGKMVYFTDGMVKALPCSICLDKEPEPLQFERTEYGASLYMEEESLIACGFERMYLRQNDEILSLPASQWDLRKSLKNAFFGQTELYIQERDLPAVASSLYEMSGERQKEALAVLGPVLSAKEQPGIIFYLDYPQEDLISCRIRANYASSGKSYDLFSQKEDKDLRNLAFEQAIGEKIWPYFDAWDEANEELIAQCENNRLYRFLTETIPSLYQYGEVMISDRLKKLRTITNPSINVGIQVDAGSLLMSLHSNELSKDEIIEILSSYNHKKRFTRLKNGSFITYDDKNAVVMEGLAESFRAYGKKNPEAMKVPLFRALYIDELLKDRDDIEFDQGRDYLKLLEELRNEESRNYSIPQSLTETLRPYQKDGYRWMRMLKTNGFGGILADDMGLGKTLQVLSFILGEIEGLSGEEGRGIAKNRTENSGTGNLYGMPESSGTGNLHGMPESSETGNLYGKPERHGPTLIVSPASLVYNWQKEIRTFTPQLSCQVLTGTAKERKAMLSQLRELSAKMTGNTDGQLTFDDIDLSGSLTDSENIALSDSRSDSENIALSDSRTVSENIALSDGQANSEIIIDSGGRLSPDRVLKSTAYQKTENNNFSDDLKDIYITSYDLLKRDIKEYEGIHFENQIIDEAQYIKNQGTQAAKAVRLIDSSFRMALTGTPIENRLSELWSIFDYIMPGFLYTYSRFREDYEGPVINDHDEDVMDRLRKMVHPFILRRLKKDVLKDLPDKLEETVSVRLEGEQRKLYDARAERLRLHLNKQSDSEYSRNKLEILQELTRLRQICCGPEVFLENYKGANAKMQACLELIRQGIDGGHKLLVFSQFTSVLDELDKKLKDEKIKYYRIDGSTPKEERMKLVDAFQNESDRTPVFCISLKAGGTGLNLTAADIVIHYDPWWNLAAQNQATDRTHRIGQHNTVTVYSLIAENTIEEQIAILQKTKAQLAEDVLSGEGISSIMIHKEDLIELLS